MGKDKQNNDPYDSFYRWKGQQEQLISTMVQVEAIIRILERKGIADMDEMLEEVKKVRLDLDNRDRRNSWEN